MGAQRTPSSSWRGTRPRARTLSTPCSSTKRGQRRKGALISHFHECDVFCALSPRFLVARGLFASFASAPVFSAYTLTRQVSLCACCVEKAFLALTAHETMVAHSVAHMETHGPCGRGSTDHTAHSTVTQSQTQITVILVASSLGSQ